MPATRQQQQAKAQKRKRATSKKPAATPPVAKKRKTDARHNVGGESKTDEHDVLPRAVAKTTSQDGETRCATRSSPNKREVDRRSTSRHSSSSPAKVSQVQKTSPSFTSKQVPRPSADISQTRGSSPSLLGQSTTLPSSGGEDGDTSFGSEPPVASSIWDTRVEQMYVEVAREHKQTLRANRAELWSRNRQKIQAALPRFQLHKQPAPTFRVFVPPAKNRFAKQAVIRKLDGPTVINRIQTVTLPEVKPVPLMVSYTSTDRNIATDDELSLSHIPFIGGLDAAEEDVFGRELRAVYEEGIHGTRVGLFSVSSRFLSDHMLFQIVDRLSRRYAEDFDEDACFASVVKLFPNKCSISKLRHQLWTDVSARYGTANADSKTVLFPNLDGPEAVAAAPEKALHSFMSLFCRRCCRYDCFLHSRDDDCSAFGYPKKKPPELDHSQLATKTPCSDRNQCYLTEYQNNLAAKAASRPSTLATANTADPLFLITDDAAEMATVSIGPPCTPTRKTKMRSFYSSPTSTDVPVNDSDDWTPTEVTLFRVLRGTFGNDYCRIARCLPNGRLTCRQVWQRANTEGPLSPQDSPLKSPRNGKKTKVDPHKQFRTQKWNGEGAQEGKVHNRYPQTPCHHPGLSCSDKAANCACVRTSGLCMKFCRCSQKCTLRFPGCRCTKQGGCKTKQCPCYYANWECDPDLCRSCTAADFDQTQPVQCQNVNLQRGRGKQLMLGVSEVAGWGCFIKDDAQKNDLISEYCGEVISQAEAERRGKIYDRQRLSYLFTLNNEYVVDAARKGNKIRFANHSANPNCYAKVIIVLGDHRIGIYAKHDIKAGEELFFNYEYNFQQKLRFVNVERKRKR